LSYSVLVVIGLVFASLCDLALLRTNLLLRKAFWLAYAIMFAFQLIVNGILCGLTIVRYDASTIVGLRLAWAPVEDLGFGFALILLTLSSWVALGRGEASRQRRSDLRLRSDCR